MQTVAMERWIGVSRYFERYEHRLSRVIGTEGAAAVTSYYKWLLGLFASVAVGVVLAVAANPGSSTAGLLSVVAAFVIACVCGVRLVILTGRGAQLASAYLTNEWGHVVRIKGVKVSLRWWQRRVDQERQRVQNEATSADLVRNGGRGSSDPE